MRRRYPSYFVLLVKYIRTYFVCQQKNQKLAKENDKRLSQCETGAKSKRLHRTGDLAGAEATGTDVHVLGSAVDNSLDPLDIGLPGAVRTAVGMGNLNAESNALIAEFAFSHG